MVKDTIDQFIWGYQRHFRMGVGRAVEALLKAIGLPTDAEACLVGFATDSSSRHQVCIEPEDGHYLQSHFEDIATRTNQLFADNPESQMLYSNRTIGDIRRADTLDESRALAVKEVLERHHPTGGLTFFVSRSARVSEYDVHVAVGLPSRVLASIPALAPRVVDDRIRITQSLLHGAMLELLRDATAALYLPDAGAGLSVIPRPVSEIARSGARRLSQSVAVLAGNVYGGELYEAMNEVSTLRYEQRVGLGHLVLAAQDRVTPTIKFDRDVPLAQRRTVRKLLELSSRGELALMTDGSDIYGLGARHETDLPTEDIFGVTVLGQGTWTLLKGPQPLMEVQYGSPRLPRPRMDQDRFEDLMARIFGGPPDCQPQALWDLAQAAARAEHGTMLVVSRIAEEEAERLQGQAIRIEPTLLSPGTLSSLTSIDGAIMLTPDGTGMAIGVILDGVASTSGDPSRGARFNSAIRYIESVDAATAIILVSEDGMINLLPDLPKRISRTLVPGHIATLRAIAAKPAFDPERFYRTFDQLRALKFYLSSEQCQEINELRRSMEERRWKEYSMRVDSGDLEPDGRMNDSYFMD